MNFDDWWGVTLSGDQKTVFALKDVMTVTKSIFENLYKEKTHTIEELVSKTYEKAPNHEKLFLNYISKRLPELKRNLQIELPADPQLLSSIEYEIYISSAEIDCYCPEDSRDCIISFFSKVLDLNDFLKNGGI
ncbi:hypothetical protein [Bacillus haynesii]|uniref:hypothetical protein n=1 Tax=Bacillus haynesii TaxID=1925021 RepID=UPI00227EAFB4|nr:hypothetical protein [Bacillus haynesii]MCY9156352.1 hypothetical protein [Bacillus haynesii]MCY9452960.1 hypothetical protein [Bacillus haynesii]